MIVYYILMDYWFLLCLGGSGFIDIDTYLYGIPFKDDSEGVVSYSLGEFISYIFHVLGDVLKVWL